MTMSGRIKIIVEFINELAGQWKGSSDPNAPNETVDIMAEEEPVADSVAVRPESHQIGITSEASPNKHKMRKNRFGAARNQLHCHDREYERGDRGTYGCRCQQSK